MGTFPARFPVHRAAPSLHTALFLGCLILGLACAPGERKRQSRSLPGDTIVVGSAVDLATINQLTGAHSRFSQDVIDQLFLHLFEEQPGFENRPPTFEPVIVRDYEWSEDNLTVRLDLRTDLVWSDGTPLTAYDVEWTYRAQVDPVIGWSYAHSKQAIEAVEVLGPHTIAFRFERVYAARLADLNQGVIMPRHLWSRLPLSEWRARGNWFFDNLVVSGPYTISHWQPQQEIILQANPRYHRAGHPRTPKIVFRIIPERSHLVRQLAAGDLDFVEQLSREDLDVLSTSKAAVANAYWHRQYTFIVWNGCREPFSRPEVRQALTFAIDRRTIVEALFGPLARVGVTPIPRSVWAFDSTLAPWPFDPERARQMLADLGWRDSDGNGVLDRDGKPFRFALSTNGDNRIRIDAASMISQQLAAIGVDARPVTLEFNALIDANMAHDFDATIAAWGIDTSLDLGYAFHTDSAIDGYNYGCYSNADVDRLIEAAADQPRLEDAATMLHEIQRHIHLDQPYTFLWEPLRIDGRSRRLRDVSSNPLSAFFKLAQWRLQDDEG